ncbi:hypothetical protein F4824DRAFT_495897 [Ustulina deusta]|nr:hypothetical protein F4824DRAFT_495897 [Ustulina deusta]
MSWDKRAMRDAVVRNKSFEGFERGRRETGSTGREGPGLREQPQIPMYAQSWDVRWPAMYDERWRMEEALTFKLNFAWKVYDGGIDRERLRPVRPCENTRLHCTARPPPESWHDDAERLDTWAVEYDGNLRNIPVTEHKGKQPHASPCKPQRWKGSKRLPIRTRTRCPQPDTKVGRPEDDEDPPSPSQNPSHAGRKVVP